MFVLYCNRINNNIFVCISSVKKGNIVLGTFWYLELEIGNIDRNNIIEIRVPAIF